MIFQHADDFVSPAVDIDELRLIHELAFFLALYLIQHLDLFGLVGFEFFDEIRQHLAFGQFDHRLGCHGHTFLQAGVLHVVGVDDIKTYLHEVLLTKHLPHGDTRQVIFTQIVVFGKLIDLSPQGRLHILVAHVPSPSVHGHFLDE